MSVCGESQVVGLIGSGITHSLTPPMHEAEADALGIRYVYRPIDLDVIGRSGDEVGDILAWARDLGYTAFNITFPCKQKVISHLDELDEGASALGAVNTVVVRDGKFVGYNTDHSGFARGLATSLPSADLTRVVQVGAGGAGSAVSYALLASGAEELLIVDIDADRADKLAASMRELFPGRSVTSLHVDDLVEGSSGATGLVNATPIGMHHHPGLSIDERCIRPEVWVADVVYRPLRTELIELAESRGCRVLDGGNMAVGQAIDTFELITGTAADPARMRATFDRFIAQGL